MKELTQEYLKEQFDYCEETGKLIHKANPQKKGQVVGGTCRTSGYHVVKLDYKSYRAHRLIWLYVHGTWPLGEIDHIDRNKLNNRIENLRDTGAPGEIPNARNRGDFRTNTSGVKGVYWIKDRKCWRASIKVGGKQQQLYSGDSFDAAVRARKEAEYLHGFT